MEAKKLKTVFTPADEPYLGRESVHIFDQLIIVCLETNTRTAQLSHKIQKTDLQLAACQIIPSGVSLALSIRELVRQSYLYGALVLMRSLVERTMTIVYLYNFPEAIDIWKRGWNHKERPNLAQMFNAVGGHKFPNCGPEITRSLNSLTHGDPASTSWNLISTGENSFAYASSKILNRPDLCDKVCMDAAVWMSVLLGMMEAIFPDNSMATQQIVGPSAGSALSNLID